MFRNMLPYSQINCKTISMCQDYFCLYTKQSIIVPSLHVDLVDLKCYPYSQKHYLQRKLHLSHDIRFCVLTSKISATVTPFVVHISRTLLVILLKEMSNIFTVKRFILVNSESLLPSVAKVISWDKCSFLCR
jgi:hypothetical protein